MRNLDLTKFERPALITEAPKLPETSQVARLVMELEIRERGWLADAEIDEETGVVTSYPRALSEAELRAINTLCLPRGWHGKNHCSIEANGDTLKVSIRPTERNAR